MDKPLWMWSLFLGIIILLLVIDLGIFNKKDHEIGIKESFLLSAFYIIIALIFGAFVWQTAGRQSGEEYFAGYLIEKSLSLDNIFVISLIFAQLHIPRKYQHRVIFWGVMGVIVLRGIMIGLGAALVEQYAWILYVFAVFLIFTGIKMLCITEKEINIYDSSFFKFIKKHFRITDKLYGNKFFVILKKNKNSKSKRYITPLFAALLLIESIDLMFAVDSIPAIFAITTDAYVVYTSNIFAILGLRALYFALAAMLNAFTYLKQALAIVLIFIGAKIFIADYFNLTKFPTDISLAIIGSLILIGIFASIFKNMITESKNLPSTSKQNKHKAPVDHKIINWVITHFGYENYLTLNKNSVARGVGAGLFAAFLPLPMQMIFAVIVALCVKGNILVAALCTWITNPITFIPLNFFIYEVGSWILYGKYKNIHIEPIGWHGTNILEILQTSLKWVESLGKPFIVGLPVVAISVSLLGFTITFLFWKYVEKYVHSSHKLKH